MAIRGKRSKDPNDTEEEDMEEEEASMTSPRVKLHQRGQAPEKTPEKKKEEEKEEEKKEAPQPQGDETEDEDEEEGEAEEEEEGGGDEAMDGVADAKRGRGRPSKDAGKGAEKEKGEKGEKGGGEEKEEAPQKGKDGGKKKDAGGGDGDDGGKGEEEGGKKKKKKDVVVIEEDEAEEDGEEEESDNDDHCHLCSKGGDLVCCDGCPRSFHAKCLGVKSAEDLEDPWYCKGCSKKRIKASDERSARKAAKANGAADSDGEEKKKKKKKGKEGGKGEKKGERSEEDEADDNWSQADDEEDENFGSKGGKLRGKSKGKAGRKKLQDSEGNSSSGGEVDSGDDAMDGLAAARKRRNERRQKQAANELDSEPEKKKKKRGRVKLVSDSESGSDSGEDKAAATPGPKKKKLKTMGLSSTYLKAAKEGESSEKLRDELRDAAKSELGQTMVLPGKKGEDGEAEPDYKLPLCISRELQAHQRVGVRFMWDNTVIKGSGTILAHCMGLGKTLQAVTTVYSAWSRAQEQEENNFCALVVAPVNTLSNWRAEFKQWMPRGGDEESPTVWSMSDADAGKLHKQRLAYLEEWKTEGGIMLIGYEAYRNLSTGRGLAGKAKHKIDLRERYTKALVNPGPDMVVCDEGHLLRNAKSGVSNALNAIKTLRRIVLSGTPLQNNLKEYHVMVDFVKPGHVGSLKEFQRNFVDPIYNGQCVDSTPADVKLMRRRSHVLHGLLKGLVDRCDYKVLQTYLPPKHEFCIAIRLTELQVKLYSRFLTNRLNLTNEGKQKPGDTKKPGAMVFKAYHALSKVWTHPYLLAASKKEDYDSMDEFVASDTESEESGEYDSMDEFVASDTESEDSGREGGWGKKKAKNKKGNKKGDASDESGSSEEEEWTKQKKEKEGGSNGAAAGGGGAVVKAEEKEDSDDGGLQWWGSSLDNKDADDISGSGKLLFTMRVLKEAEEVGDKVLIFSQSLFLLDQLESCFENIERPDGKVGYKPGVHYYRLDGSYEGKRRQIDINKFNTSKKAITYLISTKAGSLGVNLVSANRVIIMDASWNPSYDSQAIFRAYRFGQEKEVFVYRLLAHGTLEQKIYGRQVTKQALASRVVDQEETGRHFTEEDLQSIQSKMVTKQALASRVVDKEETGRQFTEEELRSLFHFTPGKPADSIEQGSAPEHWRAANASEVKEGTEGEAAGAVAVIADKKVEEEKKKDVLTGGQEALYASVAVPKDDLFARVMVDMLPKWIVGYHKSEDLIEGEEELDPEEAKAAWDEFHNREAHAAAARQAEADRIRSMNAMRHPEPKQYQVIIPGPPTPEMFLVAIEGVGQVSVRVPPGQKSGDPIQFWYPPHRAPPTMNHPGIDPFNNGNNFSLPYTGNPGYGGMPPGGMPPGGMPPGMNMPGMSGLPPPPAGFPGMFPQFPSGGAWPGGGGGGGGPGGGPGPSLQPRQ